MNNPRYDRERFCIHFVFGAVFGAALATGFWMQGWYLGLPAGLWIGGFSLLVATMGGIYGDRFWQWFLKSLRWW